MTEEYIKAGYNCDKPGIHRLCGTLGQEAEKKGNYLRFDIQEEDQFAGLDCYFTAYTRNGEEIARYAMEYKGRQDTAHTQCPDWFMEPGKISKLKKAEEEGYIPLYAYSWSDDYYALWNINAWDYHQIGTFNVKPHTMGYKGEGKRPYVKYGVTLSSALKQGYLN